MRPIMGSIMQPIMRSAMAGRGSAPALTLNGEELTLNGETLTLGV